MKTKFPYKSQDMMLTTFRSKDNGVMRLAIAYHKRKSIGELVDRGQNTGLPRWFFQTTPEWDEWTENFMHLPGLRPFVWSDDPQWRAFRDRTESGSYKADRLADHNAYMREFGPKRMLLVLDTEEQALLFKMRWQDET